MMTKRSHSGPFLLLLLLFLCSGVSGLETVVLKYYTHITSHHTWQDARSYCRRSGYVDLAIFHTWDEINRADFTPYVSWTGLQRQNTSSGPSSNWTWSDGSTDDFHHLLQNQADRNVRCATVSFPGRRFYGRDCEEHFFAFCQWPHHYRFVHHSKTWSEAQQHCTERINPSGYLATLKDLQRLNHIVVKRSFHVWTGLRKDGETWKWSTGVSQFTPWFKTEPSTDNHCVSIFNKRMHSQNCSARFPFICFKDNLVLVKENKSWEEALEHCRALRSPTQVHLRYDLVSVQPGIDHNYMMSRTMDADTQEVWTGLRFLASAWLWVNGAAVRYSDLPVCPPNWQRCGALSKNNTGSVETRDCAERRNFLCYGGKV